MEELKVENSRGSVGRNITGGIVKTKPSRVLASQRAAPVLGRVGLGAMESIRNINIDKEHA